MVSENEVLLKYVLETSGDVLYNSFHSPGCGAVGSVRALGA